MATSQPPSASGVYIREARPADSPVLNRICLLTGDAGQSAAHLHTFGELIGLVYAEPYVHLPTGFGFVLVDPAKDDDANAVVGYALSTYDTRAFEHAARTDWFPRVRAPYAIPPDGATDADKKFINILHNPPSAPQPAVDFSPAHMHIDILPEYQRQGWGRRLIARVVAYLRDERGLERMWLGLDPRNDAAKKFYEALGYKELPGAPNGTMGLEFKDFRG